MFWTKHLEKAMLRFINKSTVLAVCSLALIGSAKGQKGELIDKVLAVVGNEIVLYSDLQKRVLQAKSQGLEMTENAECFIMEEVLYEELMLHHAKVDSVDVSEDMVEGELNRRIDWFASQMGGVEKVEEFYDKSIGEIKAEFRPEIEDQLRIRSMQSTITEDVRVIPADVEAYFHRIPDDSLPFINSEIQFAHIVKEPPVSKAEKRRVRKRLETFRKDIISGDKDFCVLAELYSEDPGSKSNCGELGMVPKGVMVPEFDAVALGMQEGGVSEVFETDYGFHLMELLEKRGEQYNARHILLQPKLGPQDLLKAKRFLDSVLVLINTGETSFEKAAVEFSDDEESKNNNGLVIDPNTNSTKFDMSQVDPQVFFTIDKMTVGQISEPVIMQNPDGSRAYRVINLVSRSEPHVADLKRDWQLISNATQNVKSSEAINEWISRHVNSTFIRLDNEYETCPFDHDWAGIEESKSN